MLMACRLHRRLKTPAVTYPSSCRVMDQFGTPKLWPLTSLKLEWCGTLIHELAVSVTHCCYAHDQPVSAGARRYHLHRATYPGRSVPPSPGWSSRSGMVEWQPRALLPDDRASMPMLYAAMPCHPGCAHHRPLTSDVLLSPISSPRLPACPPCSPGFVKRRWTTR